MPANPSWIEPPPQPKKQGIGCFGKGCLALVALLLVLFLLAVVGLNAVIHQKPAPIPVQPISPEALADVQQRVDQFKNTPPGPAPSVATPTPEPQATESPEASPDETPVPASAQTPGTGRELRLTASEINGMIAANSKSRGHAFVSLSGNTATVQLSIDASKVPGIGNGYLNGTFNLSTPNGPTSLDGVQVSQVRANGMPVPSNILYYNYRGRSALSYASEALAPYNVSQVEIRDGVLIAH